MFALQSIENILNGTPVCLRSYDIVNGAAVLNSTTGALLGMPRGGTVEAGTKADVELSSFLAKGFPKYPFCLQTCHKNTAVVIPTALIAAF